jgi:type VI secretion system secreted protein VgrG
MDIVTPLGEDVLLFLRMDAREEMSRLFEYDIALLSERGDIAARSLLGKNVTVRLEQHDESIRHFNGYVTRFRQSGIQGRYHAYHATVRPWLWFLTRTADCRIFQDKTVPEIVAEVFAGHDMADVRLELTETYRKRTYCVQYRETDFDFVSRLMEQEGIYYFFSHAEGRHTLVLADSGSAHAPSPGYDTLKFVDAERLVRPEQETVRRWRQVSQIQPGRIALDDYDFERPSVDLAVRARMAREHAYDDYEMFDYPGGYLQAGDGEHYADARIDELHARHELAEGESNARGLAAGRLFKLTGQPRTDQNREYLILSVSYALRYNQYESAGRADDVAGDGPPPDGSPPDGSPPDVACTCRFTALASRQQFRPQRTTPSPTVRGPQTAVVVGPAGDEIYTDKYGRVKVQFHWDRYGKHDENSSCWIRPSHPWAGKNWGMIAIPRIGQEVIVDFLEGDPDQPIITGRVYNAEQMPPYALPANMTQTGILSRSSKGGSGANANELRFEDKKGAEQVYLHAERNQDIEVENDETHWVGHDRSKTVDHDEHTVIGANRTESVGVNETISIGANRSETVGANETIAIAANRSISVGASETASVALQRTHNVGINETIFIGAAQEIAIGAMQAVAIGAAQAIRVGQSQTVEIGDKQSVRVGADMSETIGGAQSTAVAKGRTASVGEDDALEVGKNLVIDAGDSITIQTGSASISMKKDGTILIKGKDITIEGAGKINVKASGDIVMKGAKIMQN